MCENGKRVGKDLKYILTKERKRERETDARNRSFFLISDLCDGKLDFTSKLQEA